MPDIGTQIVENGKQSPCTIPFKMGVSGELTGYTIVHPDDSEERVIYDEPIHNTITDRALHALCGIYGVRNGAPFRSANPDGELVFSAAQSATRHQLLRRCGRGTGGLALPTTPTTRNMWGDPTFFPPDTGGGWLQTAVLNDPYTTALCQRVPANPSEPYHGTKYVNEDGRLEMTVRLSYQFAPEVSDQTINELCFEGEYYGMATDVDGSTTAPGSNGYRRFLFSRITLPQNQQIFVPQDSFLIVTYELTFSFPGGFLNGQTFNDIWLGEYESDGVTKKMRTGTFRINSLFPATSDINNPWGGVQNALFPNVRRGTPGSSAGQTQLASRASSYGSAGDGSGAIGMSVGANTLGTYGNWTTSGTDDWTRMSIKNGVGSGFSVRQDDAWPMWTHIYDSSTTTPPGYISRPMPRVTNPIYENDFTVRFRSTFGYDFPAGFPNNQITSQFFFVGGYGYYFDDPWTKTIDDSFVFEFEIQWARTSV